MCLYALLITALSIVFAYFFYLYKKQKRIDDCLQCFPGPSPKFFFGNALEIGKTPTESLGNLMKIQNKYGPISRLYIGPTRKYLFVSDPEFVEVILSSTKHITKSSDYALMKPWLLNGLLLSTGNYWQRRRKIITPTFHFKILEKFISIFNKESDVLVGKLLPEVGKDFTDIFPLITACTLDSICETAMGTSVNAQNNINNEYSTAVRTMCNVYIRRKFSPWKKFDFLFQFANDYKVQRQALKILHGFTKSVIEDKKNKLKMLQEKQKDENEDFETKKKIAFLDLILNEADLNNTDILEEVETFMFEGHDTTASAISFILYELAKYPAIQNKIIEEIDKILINNFQKQPTLHDLNNMKYLELVIKEGLRKYPPVPFFSRILEEDIEFKGKIIPKDVIITIFVLHMHYQADIFSNPNEFNPERWIAKDNSEKKHNFSYIPFSAGSRNCIGQKFAMLELKAILSKILRNFKLKAADSKFDAILSGEIVLKSANGIFVRLEKRQQFDKV